MSLLSFKASNLTIMIIHKLLSFRISIFPFDKFITIRCYKILSNKLFTRFLRKSLLAHKNSKKNISFLPKKIIFVSPALQTAAVGPYYLFDCLAFKQIQFPGKKYCVVFFEQSFSIINFARRPFPRSMGSLSSAF